MASTPQDRELVISTDLAKTAEDSGAVSPQDIPVTAIQHRVERKFTLFPELPIELRLKIFRNVEVPPQVFYLILALLPHGNTFTLLTVSCASYDRPALLFTSWESRRTVIDIYQCFHKHPKRHVNLYRDLFVFEVISHVKVYLDFLSEQAGLKPKNIVTINDVNSKLAHVVVDRPLVRSLTDDSGLQYFASMKGLRSLTVYFPPIPPEEIPSQKDLEAKLRQDWRIVWEGQLEPNLFLAGDQVLDTMIAGDATWLQVKLNHADTEEAISEEEMIGL